MIPHIANKLKKTEINVISCAGAFLVGCKFELAGSTFELARSAFELGSSALELAGSALELIVDLGVMEVM